MKAAMIGVAAVLAAAGSTMAQPIVNSYTFNSYESFRNPAAQIASNLTVNGNAIGSGFNQFNAVPLSTNPIVVNEQYAPGTGGFANRHMLWFSNDGGASPATTDGSVSFGMSVRVRIQTNHPTGQGAPINSESGFWFHVPRVDSNNNPFIDEGGVWLITNGTSFAGGAGFDFALLGEGGGNNPSFPPLYTAGGWARMRFTYFAPGALGPGSGPAYETFVTDETSGRTVGSGLKSAGPGFTPGTTFGFRFQNQVFPVTLTNTTTTLDGIQLVPTPAAAALLGLGGLVAGRRRRA